jgi:hypothetical protein
MTARARYDRSMNETQAVRNLDGPLDPLSHCLDDESARRVVDFQVDPNVQKKPDTQSLD